MYTSLILTMRKENGWHVFKKMASDIIIIILKNGHFLIPDRTLKLLKFKNWHPVGYVVFASSCGMPMLHVCAVQREFEKFYFKSPTKIKKEMCAAFIIT